MTRSKLLVHGNNERFWLLSITLIIVPVLPFFENWNGAYWAISGVLLLLILSTFSKHERSGTLPLSWVDMGFMFLLGGVVIHFLKFIFMFGVPPSKEQFLNFMLLCITFFWGSFFYENPKIKWHKWVVVPFGITVLLGGFVYFKAKQVSFSYASLTNALDYATGLGNISQIAMYASFYCVLVFFLTKQKWMLAGTILTVAGLTYLLDSKMLGLVLVLCLVAKFVEELQLKKQLQLMIGGLTAGAILVLLIQPSFLAGRLDLWYAILADLNLKYVVGIGPGGFSAHINKLFLAGDATNTIGEINQLCFNDFVQVFLELGVLGIAGLGLVFYSLMQQKTAFYLLALGVILFFMFPLQYIESTALFALTILVFQQNIKTRILPFELSVKWAKKGLAVLVVLAFSYTAFQQSSYTNWLAADQVVRSGDIEKGLEVYSKTLPRFMAEEAYFLRYGLHLKQNNRHKEAVRVLQSANRLNPSYQSFIYLGDCYYEQGFFQEAIHHYSKAQRIRPEHLYPIYKSIFAWNNMDKMDEAKASWLIHKNDFEKLYSPVMYTMYTEIENLLKFNF